MKSDNLTTILNKLFAMNAAEIVTLKEIADAIGVREQRISEWVTQRSHSPNGEAAIKLQSFTASRTLHISRRPQLAERYRVEFEKVSMKFPVNGTE